MSLTLQEWGAIAPYIIFFCGSVASLVVMHVRVRKHEKILTSGENGSVPFVTFPIHEQMSETCKSGILAEIQSIKETIKKGDLCRTEAREETSNQLSAIRVDMASFKKDISDIISPLVTQVAINKNEISHLKK